MADKGQVLVGEVEDRPLTEDEQQRIAEGKPLAVGNGLNRPSFAETPPETLREYQRRAMESRRNNQLAKKLGTLQGYMEVARENASLAMIAKVTVLSGLLAEMESTDPKTGEVFLDTRLLDDKRLKRLQDAADAIEKAGGLTAPKKDEKHVQVDVNHLVADLQKKLGAAS